MIKRVRKSKDISMVKEPWLNLEALAQVEVTSEDEAHPVESSLLPKRE